MTTEVTKSSASANALAALGNLKQGLQNVQSHAPSAGGDPILKFDKGSWLYGQDNVEVEPGSEWAVNPLSFQHGFNCWKFREPGSKEKAELLGEVLVSAMQAPPLKTSLPDYGPKNDWNELIKFDLLCVKGEDDGEQVQYKPTSKGGVGATKELLAAIIKQIDDDPSKPVPVVALEGSHYTHEQYGKVFTPVLRIVRWMSMEGVEAEAPATEQPKTETASTEARTRRAAATPVQETVEDDEDETAPVTEQPAQAANDTGERRRRRRA